MLKSIFCTVVELLFYRLVGLLMFNIALAMLNIIGQLMEFYSEKMNGKYIQKRYTFYFNLFLCLEYKNIYYIILSVA